MKKQILMKYLTPLVLILCITGTPQSADIKIATYNIQNLDDKISKTRKDRLRAVLSSLNADIIGFQEIKSVSALDSVLPEKYKIAMMDTSDKYYQKLAIAVREAFTVTDIRMVFSGKDYNDEFPQKRDLLQVSIERNSLRLIVLVHHAKARSGGDTPSGMDDRTETDLRREKSSIEIRSHIDSLLNNNPDANIVLLGDFNDNPDDRSLNILEYGDPDASAGIDAVPDSFLYNTSEALLEQDHCSYGYNDIYDGTVSTDTFNVVVPGSRAENNWWRGKHYDYYYHVRIKAILFDQILVSRNLKSRVTSRGIFTGAEAVKGSKNTRASDHVPVWIVLRF